MKVLLDENIDVRFRKEFDGSGHEIHTVRYMGWNGLKNGELLRKMTEADFDVLVVVDKNLPYQENQDKLIISIFILDVLKNVLPNLKPFVPKLLAIWEKPLEKGIFIVRLDE